MAWWKKILQTIPLLVAGYEVGKSTEDNNKEVVEMLRDNLKINIEESKTTTKNENNYIETLTIIAAIIITVIYVMKMILKAIKGNRNAAAPQQQI